MFRLRTASNAVLRSISSNTQYALQHSSCFKFGFEVNAIPCVNTVARTAQNIPFSNLRAPIRTVYYRAFANPKAAAQTNKLVGVTDELVEAAKQAAESMSEQDRRKAAKLLRKQQRKAVRVRDHEHPYNGYNFSVAIVGRPNVGKSTIFNRLIGKPGALVDGSSGVTRDWKEDAAYLAGLKFRIIDTAGLDLVVSDQSTLPQHVTPFGQPLRAERRSGSGIRPGKGERALSGRDARGMTAKFALGRPLTEDLQAEILDLTKHAVQSADLVLFVVDTRAGLSPMDEYFAKWVRKLLKPKGPTLEDEESKDFNPSSRDVLRRVHNKPVVLIANKYDYGGDDVEANLIDFYKLGFGEPVAFSATHASGFGELFSSLVGGMNSILQQWADYQTKVTALFSKRRAEELKSRSVKVIASPESINEYKGTESVLNDDASHKRDQVEEEDLDEIPFRPSRSLRRKTVDITKSTLTPQIAEDELELWSIDEDVAEEEEHDQSEEDEQKNERQVIKVCIAGRPNVGKSTLVNAILGEKRLLTGPQPGVTRDTVTVHWNDARYPNYDFELVDTAGMKGTTTYAHSKFDRVDSMAMASSMQAVRKANVVVLVLDIAEGLYGQTLDPVFASQIRKNFVEAINQPEENSKTKQMNARDRMGKRSSIAARVRAGLPIHGSASSGVVQSVKDSFGNELGETVNLSKGAMDRGAYQDRIRMAVSRVAGAVTRHDIDVAAAAAKEGKAVVVVANKIDLLEQDEIQVVLLGLQEVFRTSLAQSKGVSIVALSAIEQQSIAALPGRIVQSFEQWDNRISTGLLNRWLRAVTVLRPPPNIDGRAINLKYITQTNTRPPSFAIFCARAKVLPEAYKNMLTNALRDEFNLQGVPIRVHIRSGHNPYTEDAGKGRPSSLSGPMQNRAKRAKEARVRQNSRVKW